MKRPFLAIVLTAVVAIALAATLSTGGEKFQYETSASVSVAEVSDWTSAAEVPYYALEASAMPEVPNPNYELGLEALEEDNVPQAVVYFTMGYAQDEDPEMSLEQLQLIKQKYGDEIDIPLLDMLESHHNLKFSVGKFIMADNRGKYGAQDAFFGEEFLPFVYDSIDEIYSTTFSTYWAVGQNGKKGLINAHTGDETLPIEYNDFFPIAEEFLSNGIIGIPTELETESQEYIGAKKSGKSGIIALENKKFYPVDGVIYSFYSSRKAGDPGEAQMIIKTTNAQGDSICSLKTLNGKTLIGPALNCSKINVWQNYLELTRQTPTLQNAYARSDGTIMQNFAAEYPRQINQYVALVDAHNKWSFYNLINWQKLSGLGEFDNVMTFTSDEPVFAVNRNGKWALLNVAEASYKSDFNFPVQPGGEELINIFRGVVGDSFDMTDERMLLEARSTAIIMVDGEITFPASLKDNDIRLLSIKDEHNPLLGTMGTDGKLMIQPEYAELKQLPDNRYLAEKPDGDHYIVIDRNGNKKADTDWDKVDFYEENNFIVVKKKGKDLYGIVDMNLKVIHPCKYTEDEIDELINLLINND